jgi:hypothetical protein
MKWSRTEGLADYDRPCKRQYYAWRKHMDDVRHAKILIILSEIGREIERAKEEWGEEFDRKNNLDNWVTYAVKYLGKAAAMGATVEEQETNLRKAAGVLISAIDMLKREGFAPRHYEGSLSQRHSRRSNEIFRQVRR